MHVSTRRSWCIPDEAGCWRLQGSGGSSADGAAHPDPFAASLAPPASSSAAGSGRGPPARTVTPQSADDPFAPSARSMEATPSGSARQQQQQVAGTPGVAPGPPKKSAEDILKMFDAPQVRASFMSAQGVLLKGAAILAGACDKQQVGQLCVHAGLEQLQTGFWWCRGMVAWEPRSCSSSRCRQGACLG